MSAIKPKRVSGVVKQRYLDVLVGLVVAILVIGMVLARGVT